MTAPDRDSLARQLEAEQLQVTGQGWAGKLPKIRNLDGSLAGYATTPEQRHRWAGMIKIITGMDGQISHFSARGRRW
jgi:hypothetical protein